MDEIKISDLLKTVGLSQIRFFDSIGSTNDEGFNWIEKGAQDLSLVIADEQTKGRGRFQRRWISNPGSGLAFTLILKPTADEINNIAFFAPLCGLAVHDAINKLYGISSQIKWPNDVLIDRRKVSGILVEANWTGNKLDGLVLGIGVNVAKESLPPVEFQSFSATTLEDILGNLPDRFELLQEILLGIRKWRPLLASPEFFTQWRKNLAFKGEWISIEDSGKPSIIGKEEGIDNQGRIVLTSKIGEKLTFEVGDVHLRPGIN